MAREILSKRNFFDFESPDSAISRFPIGTSYEWKTYYWLHLKFVRVGKFVNQSVRTRMSYAEKIHKKTFE
jgi:hypothetical protein